MAALRETAAPGSCRPAGAPLGKLLASVAPPPSTPKGAASMDLWTRLEQARAACNVLEHPFYQRWSRGELEREELAAYAGQYRHAVVALAEAAAGAARTAPPE